MLGLARADCENFRVKDGVLRVEANLLDYGLVSTLADGGPLLFIGRLSVLVKLRGQQRHEFRRRSKPLAEAIVQVGAFTCAPCAACFLANLIALS